MEIYSITLMEMVKMKDKRRCSICGRILKYNEKEICSRCSDKLNTELLENRLREGWSDI